MLEVIQNNQTEALIICPVMVGVAQTRSLESRVNEVVGLAKAIGLNVAEIETPRLKEIRAALYFSKSYIEKWKSFVEEKKIDLFVLDGTLSAIQQRNIEKELRIKVIDRTALILEIFGARAQTREGKLQVSLAHLTYQRSRLVKSWTHLERQRGGAGFLGGPGEKQKELDRRVLDEEIIKIKKELEKVKNTRGLQREKRQKVPYDIVVLVGYTNAGKSTLFNTLTKENVLAKNMLFATLDPTLRQMKLPSGREVIISDTVGFISDLPHELVMSFRATLEEVLEADLIIHVRDISNPDHQKERADVLDVLHHLGLENIENQSNYIEVFNKTDMLSETDQINIINRCRKSSNTIVPISAMTGFGTENLLQLMDQKLMQNSLEAVFHIPSIDGQAQSLIYQLSYVIERSVSEDAQIIYFTVKADLAHLQKLKFLLAKYL